MACAGPAGYMLAGLLAVGAVVVLALWACFLADYPATRDLYFTVALAHVLAEAPFLLRAVSMDEFLQFLWSFLLPGYLTTVAIETPILLIGLSPRHPISRRLFCGFWLTACTYQIVVLVLAPLLLGSADDRTVYLLVAETFAPVAECALFWAASAPERNGAHCQCTVTWAAGRRRQPRVLRNRGAVEPLRNVASS